MKTSPANAAFPLILIAGGLLICAHCENPNIRPKASDKRQEDGLSKTVRHLQTSSLDPQTSGGGQQDLEALINTLQSPFKDRFREAFQDPITVNNRVKLIFGGDEGTVVHIAAREDNVAVLEALLQLSPKPDLEIEADQYARPTVLQAAVEADAHRAVPLLVKAGADPKRALWPIVKYKKPSMVATLKAAGVDFTQYDADDVRLQYAVSHNDLETVRALLDAGVRIKDKQGSTASLLEQVIYSSNQKPLFDLLLARGADVNKKKVWENTLLHTAAQYGPKETIEALVDALGVDPVNSDGETPLFLAAIRGHVIGVETLLEQGADVNRANSYGRTPLAIAKLQNKPKIISLLENAGGTK